MKLELPIWIMEPDSAGTRETTARKLAEKRETASPETASIRDIKNRLREIREFSKDNMRVLAAELLANLSERYPQTNVRFASDSDEAVKYIVSNGTKHISMNNSAVVAQELRPGLISRGVQVIDSYFEEFNLPDPKIGDYWDLPRLLDKNIGASLGVSRNPASTRQADGNKIREYTAVLGVNAVAADGTAYFSQHFNNIYRDLTQAHKVILIVGLDKIVKSREDAALQTRCMGIFGLESRLLLMESKPEKAPTIAELADPICDGERELHIILLDNGRTRLSETRFKDLLLCIGCMACNGHCPIRRFFADAPYIWTPKTYLNQFILGAVDSLDVCLHCEACRMECPLQIDLPALMWQAKMEYAYRYDRPLHHRILGRPEFLAKLGTSSAPLANAMMASRSTRVLMEFITGIDRKTVLPVFHSHTFRKWFNDCTRRSSGK